MFSTVGSFPSYHHHAYCSPSEICQKVEMCGCEEMCYSVSDKSPPHLLQSSQLVYLVHLQVMLVGLRNNPQVLMLFNLIFSFLVDYLAA